MSEMLAPPRSLQDEPGAVMALAVSAFGKATKYCQLCPAILNGALISFRVSQEPEVMRCKVARDLTWTTSSLASMKQGRIHRLEEGSWTGRLLHTGRWDLGQGGL